MLISIVITNNKIPHCLRQTQALITFIHLFIYTHTYIFCHKILFIFIIGSRRSFFFTYCAKKRFYDCFKNCYSKRCMRFCKWALNFNGVNCKTQRKLYTQLSTQWEKKKQSKYHKNFINTTFKSSNLLVFFFTVQQSVFFLFFVPKKRRENWLANCEIYLLFLCDGIWCSVFIVNNLQIFYSLLCERVFFFVRVCLCLCCLAYKLADTAFYVIDSGKQIHIGRKFRNKTNRVRSKTSTEFVKKTTNNTKSWSYLIVRRTNAANGIDEYSLLEGRNR